MILVLISVVISDAIFKFGANHHWNIYKNKLIHDSSDFFALHCSQNILRLKPAYNNQLHTLPLKNLHSFRSMIW